MVGLKQIKKFQKNIMSGVLNGPLIGIGFLNLEEVVLSLQAEDMLIDVFVLWKMQVLYSKI